MPKSAQCAQMCPAMPRDAKPQKFYEELFFGTPCISHRLGLSFFNDISTEKYNGKGRQKSIESEKTLQSKVWRKVHSSVEETSRRLCIGRWGEVGVREVTGLGSTHG